MTFYCKSFPASLPRFLHVTDAERTYRPCIVHAGHERFPGRGPRGVAEHSDCYYHIVLFVEGEGTYRSEGRDCAFRPGTLAVTHPGLSHVFTGSRRGGYGYREVTFSFEANPGDVLNWTFARLLEYYSGRAVRIETPAVLPPPERLRLEQSLCAIPRRLAAMDASSWIDAFSFLLDALLLIARKIAVREPERPAGAIADERLEKARLAIESDFNRPLHVARLASAHGFSAGHFQRVFKAAYGRAPLAYQQKMRLDVACRLLLESGYRIGEIARRVGYENPYYFSRLFKARFDVAPRHWVTRQKQRSPR